jgi:hypothetical protein
MQSAAMFEIRKRLSTVSLAKPRYIPESILRIYEHFIGGDMHYINGSFLKKCAKDRRRSPGCELHVLLIVTTIIVIFVFHMMFRELHW